MSRKSTLNKIRIIKHITEVREFYKRVHLLFTNIKATYDSVRTTIGRNVRIGETRLGCQNDSYMCTRFEMRRQVQRKGIRRIQYSVTGLRRGMLCRQVFLIEHENKFCPKKRQ